MFTDAGLDEITRRLDGIVQDKPEEGIFRARRDMFTDPELFELEMKHIWEGNWIYLAHESQIPNVNDTFTTHIGRQPMREGAHLASRTAGRRLAGERNDLDGANCASPVLRNDSRGRNRVKLFQFAVCTNADVVNVRRLEREITERKQVASDRTNFWVRGH